MTDVRAVTVFRFFGGNQLVFASNTVYSKGGAAIGYHHRHGNLLDTDPDKIKLSIIHIMGESFVCRTAPKGLRAGSAHHICCTAIRESGDLPLGSSRQRA
jgi:hypothetical protein